MHEQYKNVISRINKKTLHSIEKLERKNTEKEKSLCNCRNKNLCLLKNNCLTNNVIYKATVITKKTKKSNTREARGDLFKQAGMAI